jgi:uncharacterized protein YjbI with pentapeptide repeats
MSDANLSGTNLGRASLNGAALNRADVTDAISAQKQLDAACGKE